MLFVFCCWTVAAGVSVAQTRKSAQQKARTVKTTKKNTGKTTRKTQAKTKQTKTVAQPTVKGLQNQRQQLQKQIKEQEQRLQANRKNVKQRLENLQMINTEIADKRRTIDTIRHDIGELDKNITSLDIQLKN